MCDGSLIATCTGKRDLLMRLMRVMLDRLIGGIGLRRSGLGKGRDASGRDEMRRGFDITC